MKPAALVFALAIVADRGGVATSRPDVLKIIETSGADVAVAFQTLDGRDELLIQPDVEFHAASTMKVPVMIELFRRVRRGELTLDESVPVTNAFHSIVDGSSYTLEPDVDSDAEVYEHVGGRLSYRALCEAMITTSSNLAANLLIERLRPARIQATTDALGARGMHVLRGVEDTKAFEKGLNNTTTARALLTLMGAIAKGSAGDKASTDEMIAILKRQTFNDRIPAGVPAGIQVAHKTGEITRIQHDAAIVFARRPFVLVVLVRGLDDATKSAAMTAEITRTLYAASQRTP
jgi:beta-lactamase class A